MATYKPDSVVFYIRPEEPYDSGFESPPVNCKPAWPVPVRLVESDSKTNKNAKAWSLGHWTYRDYLEGDIQGVVGVNSPNIPRKGYRIVGAEQRNEGGRAWKVITPDGYLVDMRENVVMTILLRDGIPKDGMLTSEFVWGAKGSNCKLIEVGSTEWKNYERDWAK